MKQEEQDKIKGYYDRTGEWKRKERYSEKYMTVYTKDDDKYHWLVVEEGIYGIEVQQTKEDGTIIARDYYKSAKNEITCTGMERMCADGSGMALFTEKELNLFYQLKGTEKERILADLRIFALKSTDKTTREYILTVVMKLEVLSEASIMELMTTIQNYKFLGRRIFIRKKKVPMPMSL